MRTFDTYTHINDLKEAGFDEKQAAVIIKSLVDSRETDISNLATKELVNAIEHRLVNVEKTMSTKDQIDSLRNEMKAMILDTHTSTLKWMVGTMIGIVGIMIAAIKLF